MRSKQALRNLQARFFKGVLRLQVATLGAT
jgi:hypothetical protein